MVVLSDVWCIDEFMSIHQLSNRFCGESALKSILSENGHKGQVQAFAQVSLYYALSYSAQARVAIAETSQSKPSFQLDILFFFRRDSPFNICKTSVAVMILLWVSYRQRYKQKDLWSISMKTKIKIVSMSKYPDPYPCVHFKIVVPRCAVVFVATGRTTWGKRCYQGAMANVERDHQIFEDRSNKTEQTQINGTCI